MSARPSQSLPLPPRASSLMMDEDVREGKKQGIVTVLVCDPGTARAASLRRTLSADMSREWLAKNGFHPLKKTASSVSIEDSSSSDDEEDTLRKDVEGQVYIWKSMKEARRDDAESEKREETWSTILFQKVVDSKSLPQPYVHPMVKRSKNCLSTKSLDVCTESLGSETGSDGFSLYPASEVRDVEAEDGHEPRAPTFDIDEFYVAKCNHATATRKKRPQSFPPLIQSLSQGNGGGSVSMRSHRDNGRLVLEAISVPSERNFEARREEGRLVLTFANNNESYRDKDNEDMDEEEDEWVMKMDEDISTEEDKEEEETEENDEEGVDTEFVLEWIPKLSSGGPVNIHKLAKMLNKPITVVNMNPGGQGQYVGAFDYGEGEEEDPTQLEQSLPLQFPVARVPSTPQPVPSTAMSHASLNAYEYFWRNKTPANTFIASIGQSLSALKGHGINISVYAKNLPSDEALKNQPLTRRAGYLTPLLQCCNSPSRTNLLWETKCIATS